MRLYKIGSAQILFMSLIAGTAHAGTNPGIAPIQSKPHGKAYNEWAAEWWKWALEIPASVNPLLDTTGANAAQGQSGHVWFLAGAPGSDPVTREVEVPRGTALFFPLINLFYGAFLNDPPPTRTENFIRSQVTCVEDATFFLVEIDGVAVINPKQYQEKSVIFDIFLPEDNIFGLTVDVAPELTLSPSVDEGFYLFVHPLKPGKHTIRWRASACGGTNLQDVTYHLTVR